VEADFLKAFGERVRAMRVARGLSQEKFAHGCGLDRTYISGIERGRRNPSLRNVHRIAKELGVSVSELCKALQ